MGVLGAGVAGFCIYAVSGESFLGSAAVWRREGYRAILLSWASDEDFFARDFMAAKRECLRLPSLHAADYSGYPDLLCSMA